MGSIIFVETSAEAAAKRECAVIEEKMDLWVKAVDALNAACRDFAKYYVSSATMPELSYTKLKRKT